MTVEVTTTSLTTTTDTLTGAGYTFAADLATDGRSRVAVVSALVGTQPGVTVSSVDKPKKVIFKKPAQFAVPRGYNAISGRYAVVPKNSYRIIGQGAANVTASQIETIPIVLDIAIPAGATSYDRANVEASFLAFLGAVHEMREELLKAFFDGRW